MKLYHLAGKPLEGDHLDPRRSPTGEVFATPVIDPWVVPGWRYYQRLFVYEVLDEEGWEAYEIFPGQVAFRASSPKKVRFLKTLELKEERNAKV